MHSSALILCTLTCNLQDPISSGRKIDKGFLCTSSQRAKSIEYSHCVWLFSYLVLIVQNHVHFLLVLAWILMQLIPPHWLKCGYFMGWDLPRISWNIEIYQNIKSYTVNWTELPTWISLVLLWVVHHPNHPDLPISPGEFPLGSSWILPPANNNSWVWTTGRHRRKGPQDS